MDYANLYLSRTCLLEVGNSGTVLSYNVISLHTVRHVISCGSDQGSVHIASFHGPIGDERHSTGSFCATRKKNIDTEAFTATRIYLEMTSNKT